jgi:hypothetical protein
MTRTAAIGLFLVVIGTLQGCAGDAPPAAGAPARLASGAALRSERELRAGSGFSGRVVRLRGDEGTERLAMRRSFGDSTRFARVSSITVLGSRLLVTDRLMSQHIAVIDRATGRIERQFGSHGRGPGEFFDPMWTIPIPGDSSAAWLYDFQNRRLTRLDLPAQLPASSLPTRPLDLGVSVTQIVRAGDRLIANGLFPDYTLLVMDTTGAPLQRVAADPPFGPKDVPYLDGRRALNRNFLAYRPAGGAFALAYQFRSRIDFFNAKGERYGTISGPRPSTASVGARNGRMAWKPENEMAFRAAFGTDRYLYALFCGCRADDEPREARVQVFRWNGDFVTELVLDHPVIELAVTPDDRVLYGALEEPFPGVGEWALPARLADASRQALATR